MSELYLQPLFAPEVLDDRNAGGIAITHFPFVQFVQSTYSKTTRVSKMLWEG